MDGNICARYFKWISIPALMAMKYGSAKVSGMNHPTFSFFIPFFLFLSFSTEFQRNCMTLELPSPSSSPRCFAQGCAKRRERRRKRSKKGGGSKVHQYVHFLLFLLLLALFSLFLPPGPPALQSCAREGDEVCGNLYLKNPSFLFSSIFILLILIVHTSSLFPAEAYTFSSLSYFILYVLTGFVISSLSCGGKTLYIY